MVKLDKEIEQRLLNLSEVELCQVYHSVNAWEWNDLLGPKPEGFDDLPLFNYKWYHEVFRRKAKETYTHPIYCAVSKLVPVKELMRYHHTHNLRSTNEEFERWWSNRRTQF